MRNILGIRSFSEVGVYKLLITTWSRLSCDSVGDLWGTNVADLWRNGDMVRWISSSLPSCLLLFGSKVPLALAPQLLLIACSVDPKNLDNGTIFFVSFRSTFDLPSGKTCNMPPPEEAIPNRHVPIRASFIGILCGVTKDWWIVATELN